MVKYQEDTRILIGNLQEQVNKDKAKAIYFKCKMTVHLESVNALIARLRLTVQRGI